MIAGNPLVNEKLAELVTPATLAVTVYDPNVLLAVKVGAVATPSALVAAVAEFPLPAKVPLAPLAGAVKVTLTPLTGSP